MNDDEKKRKSKLNVNVFVKLKKLMLKHNKKKTNDEHENNNHVLLVDMEDSQAFQVGLPVSLTMKLNFSLLIIKYFHVKVEWEEWVEWVEWAEWAVEPI